MTDRSTKKSKSDCGDDRNDGPTLREVAARACKYIDIGTAVLPKPLFVKDWDEETYQNSKDRPGDNDAEPRTSGENNNDKSEKIACATVDVVTSKTSLPRMDHDETASVPRYAQIARDEFNAVVLEHHLKWAPLCETLPGPIDENTPSTRMGRYDFHHADAVVDWAIRHNMKVKGHVLVWHVTSPSFIQSLSPQQLRQEMKRHIHTTIGHFRGRIRMWDVVNEALAPDGTMARNIFYQKLGAEYVELAFRYAHDAEPNAFLIYNDNKVEGMYGANAAKSRGYYNLLKDLLRKRVPVHGAGIQAHFNAGGVGRQRPPTPRSVKAQIKRLGELGLRVNISEMDVRVGSLPPPLRPVAQRQIYHDIIAAALSEPAFDGVWIWGFADRHTWVTHFYGKDHEPLLFDENYKKKEAYYGLRDAISTLTVGGTVGGAHGCGVYLHSDYDKEGRKWGQLWMQPEPVDEKQNEGDGTTECTDAGDSRPDWLQDES